MKICFVADNRNRKNWGCRATSIALKDLLSSKYTISDTIYGDLTFSYDFYSYTGEKFQNSFKFKFFSRIPFVYKFFFRNIASFIDFKTEKSLSSFFKIKSDFEPLKTLDNKIQSADAVVLNGEGSFIFSLPERYDTKFYLFIIALAKHYKKKIFLLNAMFSPGASLEINQDMICEAKKILSYCDIITARDPLSFQFFKEHLGDKVTFVPDALFSWKKVIPQYLNCSKDFPLVGIPTPELDSYWKDFIPYNQYICISGSSLAPRHKGKAISTFINLVTELKKKWNVVLLATCAGDSFLEIVAKETSTKFIPVETNLFFGTSILAQSQVFISGRWHPSILASLCGTPCVFLKSNSHKTRALPIMLDNPLKTEFSCFPNTDDIQDISIEVEHSIANKHQISNLYKKNIEQYCQIIENFKLD